MTPARDLVRDPVMSALTVDVFYGDKHAVKNVSLDIGRNQVLAMIGPSGCGKSSFLRCLNRMNDTIAQARVTGVITLDGQDIYRRDQDVAQFELQKVLPDLATFRAFQGGDDIDVWRLLANLGDKIETGHVTKVQPDDKHPGVPGEHGGGSE